MIRYIEPKVESHSLEELINIYARRRPTTILPGRVHGGTDSSRQVIIKVRDQISSPLKLQRFLRRKENNGLHGKKKDNNTILHKKLALYGVPSLH
jgi:hypothetical protein